MTAATEILKKIRALEIKSRKLANNLFTGEYHSAFRGNGMTFKEVKEYTPGDDTRFIDWNVTAKFGHLYSKVFEEERELSVMILMDISNSSLFGVTHSRKKDLAIEMAAVLAFAAINNGDKLGVILFSDIIESYIPPKKGRQQAMFILKKLLNTPAKSGGTNIEKALTFLNNINRKKSIVFLISDFLDTGFENSLKISGKKHDLIGIKIYDLVDVKLPKMGMVYTSDLETGNNKWVDTNSFLVRQQYEQEFFAHTNYSVEAFEKSGSSLLHCKTDEDYVKILQRFFLSRNK